MSFAFMIIRLEVSDKDELPKELNYSAPGFVRKKESSSLLQPSYAAVASDSTNSIPPTPHPEEPEAIDFRGQRTLQDISIVTYNHTGFLLNELHDHRLSMSKEINHSETESDTKDKDKQVEEGVVESEPKSNTSREGSAVSDSSSDSVSKAGKEVRFQPIVDGETPGPSDGPGMRTGGAGTRPKSQSPTSSQSSTISFYSGNPMVEKVRGILHVYKDNQLNSFHENTSRSELICMLAVPAVYTIHDLLKFLAPVIDGVAYLRVIRDTTPNQYMVLVKFKTQKKADDFYFTYNNTSYNSIETDICHLVYVGRIESLKESDGACLPVPGLTEMPNCAVCLERMDESLDGILTILCNHAFHMSCLAQWGDTSCPVCRYCQTPEEVADNRCMKCGSQESLWICLICGHIGCGRYVGLHAYRHFQETQHTYAMELGNNKVWDYVGDNYVHRLVQNKSDGKLVQVDEGGHPIQEEKLDSLTLEYTYLLTNQLESQRLYFEEKMDSIEKEAAERVTILEMEQKEISEECKKFETDLIEVSKDKQQLDRKCTHLQGRLKKALHDLQEEREMNKCLRENQNLWQKRVSTLETQLKDFSQKKDEEIQELRDQLRDVMFYVEAQQKLANTTDVSQEEIQEGQIIVGAAAASPPAGKKTRKKQR